MKLSQKQLATILTFLFLGLFVLHILVISQIIPYQIVWGGKLKSLNEMYRFEAVSMLENTLFLIVVLLAGKFLKWRVKPLILKIALYLMALFFALNTFGNLMSENNTERLIFTPITIVLAWLCFKLAVSKFETPQA